MSGEPVFTPANSMSLSPKVDDDWHHEDTGDSNRASVGGLQAVSQTPQLQPLEQLQLQPLCRALYDFNPEGMNVEDSKYCLSFLKVCHSNCRLHTTGTACFHWPQCVYI